MTCIIIHDSLGTDIPLIPVALSMYAVTGLVPSKAPIEIENASTQYAMVEFSKSNVTGSRSPANLAIEYRVLMEISTTNQLRNGIDVYPVVSVVRWV
jgi:hypothetical protein